MIQLYKENKKPRFMIVQIGTGGNGSYLLQHISQMLGMFSVDSFYLVADPDRVESKNLKNQLFIPSDISKSKAEVLAKRYRSHYQNRIAYFDEHFIEEERDLEKLFSHLNVFSYDFNSTIIPVLIGCVDNNYTRKLMHRYFEKAEFLIYLDAGIESTFVPQDRIYRKDWTEEELKRHNESGWTGQVVCGVRDNNKTLLPSVTDKFPDIWEDQDEIAPSQLSCSNIVSHEPQRLITNRFAALVMANYLNEMFSEGTITNSMTFFNAKSGYMRSEKVKNS